MPKFRFGASASPSTDSPRQLFRDLPGKDPSVKFLWEHQAALLDEYYKAHLKTSDLAIELPTGSGKTLVALLIAEYRRRVNNERAVFLCPTRQLCSQVAAQAKKYGIATALLTGSQRDYPSEQFNAYQKAKSVAITTYSGVFNTSPRIDDPELIICDDAHSADNYVSALWTVSISRYEHADVFQALYRALRPALPENVIHDFDGFDPKTSRNFIDLVSTISSYEIFKQIREVLNTFAEEVDDRGRRPNWSYSWGKISGHLDACSLYCAGDRIEICPVISPTETHLPFADAQQRLYMSATLGEDGDIERTFGVKKIARLPIPAGWDKQGTGRRLVLFPGSSLNQSEVWNLIATLNKEVDRSLILVPDDRSLKKVQKDLKDQFPVLTASDIEQSIDTFTKHKGHPVLIVANRWEGIDLPGEDCRMLTLAGLPSGAGLQEQYLMERLGAVSQFRDRIRTRVTQAMGRCTRDASDYSIVFMTDSKLLKWCCTKANIAGIHPELQAEISGGLEMSENVSANDILEMCRDFLGQRPEWREAEKEIIARRKTSNKVKDATAEALANVAPLEIDFIYALWNGKPDLALNTAGRVLEGLSGGDDLKPYRSFWHHQAAVASYLAYRATQDEKFKRKAVEQLDLASNTSYGLRWLGALRSRLMATPSTAAQTYPVREWYRVLEELLTEWNIRGKRYQREVAKVEKDLSAVNDAKAFERGLLILGQMLGARVHQWTTDGAPDGLWMFGDWLAFVFEAKTDEKPDSLSLKNVRQALTHEQLVRSEKRIPDYMPCMTVVISNHPALHNLATPHTGELWHLTQGDIVNLFKKASAALSQLRDHVGTVTEETAQAEAEKTYRMEGVFMPDVQESLLKIPLRSMLVK